MCGGGGDVFQSIGDTLASVDPGPTLGDLGVSIDKTVNDVVPGGWITVGALTAGGLALAYAPEVMAFAEANNLTPAVASESLGIAPVNAATGEVVAPDVFAGLSANAPVDTALSQAAAAGAGSAGTGITGNAVVDATLTGAGKGAALGGGKALLTGQDPLTGALNGAATGAVGGGFGNLGTQLTDSNIVGAVAGGIGGGATGAAINGRDPLTGALIGGFTGGTTAGINELTDSSIGSIFSPLTGTAISNLFNSGSGGGTQTALSIPAMGLNTTGGTGVGGVNASSNPTNYQGTFVKGSQIESPLSNFAIPVNNYAPPANNPNQLQEIEQAAEGGIMRPVHLSEGGEPIPEGFFKPWKPIQSRGQKIQGHPGLTAFHGVGLKSGGEPSMQEVHDPQFFSEGGLNAIQHRYVTGAGDGTSDSIPAMLANGEFVIPADVVSSLGNGSNDSGAKVLDSFLKTIRKHKQKHNAKHLPPDSKGPLAYLLEAKHKARS